MSQFRTSIPGYKKDKRNNVVINTNAQQYQEYVRQVAKSKRFNEMQKELADLKQIVTKLLEDKGH